MTFTAGKRCAPTLVIIALAIIVAALVYLVTAKSHHYRPVAAPIDSHWRRHAVSVTPVCADRYEHSCQCPRNHTRPQNAGRIRRLRRIHRVHPYRNA